MKVIVYYDFLKLKNVKNAVCFSVYNKYVHIYYIKNYKVHNDKFYAGYMFSGNDMHEEYYYYFYDENIKEIDYKDKNWIKQVKELKRQEKLKIFI